MKITMDGWGTMAGIEMGMEMDRMVAMVMRMEIGTGIAKMKLGHGDGNNEGDEGWRWKREWRCRYFFLLRLSSLRSTGTMSRMHVGFEIRRRYCVSNSRMIVIHYEDKDRESKTLESRGVGTTMTHEYNAHFLGASTRDDWRESKDDSNDVRYQIYHMNDMNRP